MGIHWLREVPATSENQRNADKTHNSFREWWPHSTYARCPGCRTNKGLVYLEFRNDSSPSDTFRNYSILGVCREMAARLLELRDSGHVFGVSALVRQSPWICAKDGETVPVVAPPSLSTCGRCRYCVERASHPQQPSPALSTL